MSQSLNTALAPADRIFVPHRKRISQELGAKARGGRELIVRHRGREHRFEEPRWIDFVERLLGQASFTAYSATAWGQGYPWPEVRALLEELLAEGLLRRAEPAEDPDEPPAAPSPLPPAPCPVPRRWAAAECERITAELGGRPVELGHLEAVVSAAAIAGTAVDAEGRQLGEGHVYPAGLRLECATDWRVCLYPGSRYRDEAPMNASALRSMIACWRPMLTALLAIRDEVLPRLPRSRQRLCVGDLHAFSRVALAVPAFALMRDSGSGASPLHPILSALSRAMEGIRLATHDMLLLSAERTRSPDEPLDAAELYGFAERNGLFLSERGVCAGPRMMMEQLFAVIFDGAGSTAAARELPAEVVALLGQLPDAVDYGFLGLQSWAAARTVWLEMSRAHRRLLELCDERNAAVASAALSSLRARLGRDFQLLERERVAAVRERELHRALYADAYERARRALREPVGEPTLAAQLAPGPLPPRAAALHAEKSRALRRLLAARVLPPAATRSGDVDRKGPSRPSASGGAWSIHPAARRVAPDPRPGDRFIEQLAEGILSYLRTEQGVLAALAELQGELNRRLGRAEPRRPLTVRDLHLAFRMSDPPRSETPYLLDALEEELGIRIDCFSDRIELVDQRNPLTA